MISGYYPTKNPSILYISGAIVNWFFSLSLILSMLIHMYLNIEDGEKVLQTLYFLLTEFTYVCKVINLISHKKLILEIEKILISFDEYNQNAKPRIEALIKHCSKLSFRYLSAVYICGGAYGVGGIFFKNPENQMPIPGWFPVNVNKYADWLAAYQTIAILSTGLNNTILDILAWCMINAGSTQLLILMDSLQNIHNVSNSNGRILENKQKIILGNLKKCVDHNNKILQ